MSIDLPRISVIVPAFNEERWIGACLAHLKDQSYPQKSYEIIVVDNGSTDDTAKIALKNGVTLLSEPRRSAYLARNLAIERSSGDWLAFTDADCLADYDWLMNLWQCADRNRCVIVSGLTVYNLVRKTFGNWLYVQSHKPETLRSAVLEHNCVAGGNMLVNRHLINEIGNFKETMSGSDIEFSKRAASAGHSICFAEDARTSHQCDLSSIEYLRRTFSTRYGQTMHSEQRGFLSFIANFNRLPWRPGFRVPKPSMKEGEAVPHLIFWWVYCWINRWMGFLGSQWAMTIKLFIRNPN